jgi:Protein of unknown function (DUF3011)
MTTRQAALAALTLLCLAGAQPAALASEESGWMSAPEATASKGSGTVTCESHNDGRRHCAVANIDTESVYVERKLSQTHCQHGVNWGVDRDGIWVDGGCRAVFAFVYRQGGGGSSSSRPGRPGTIECGSQDDRRRHCEVPNIDPDSVTMDRQLSHANCHRGQSWGTESRGIWVDKGCRAEFGYVTRNGGHGGGGASESSMREACINRAAREWSVTTSNLEITHAERQQNGGYRFSVQSKRTSGTCMVDRSGHVYRLDTH